MGESIDINYAERKGADLAKKKKVVLIKTGARDRDIRMPKEIEAIKRAGCEATILFWNNQGKPARAELWAWGGDYCPETQLGLRAPSGIKMLVLLPVWWCFEFFRLMLTKWDIAHAICFGSIVPAVIAGKLKRKPVIYEIQDAWEDMRVLPKVVRYICIQVDKLFMRLANAVILVDEAQIQGFGGVPNSRVITVYDSPPDSFRKSTAKGNDRLALFYAGVLYQSRRLNLDKVVSAISDIDNVKLIIAGHGNLVEEIKEWSRQMPNKIEFIGRSSYRMSLKEVPWLTSCSRFVLR